MGKLFADTATVYHYDGVAWRRRVLQGVFWKEERTLRASGGMQETGMVVRMRAPVQPDGYAPAQTGDVMMKGEGPEISGEYGMDDLRRTHACCVVCAVADNTGRARLGHWRIDGE